MKALPSGGATIPRQPTPPEPCSRPSQHCSSMPGKMLPGRVFQHTVGLGDDRISVSMFISSTVSLLLCVCLCYLDQILEFGIKLGSGTDLETFGISSLIQKSFMLD